LDGQQDTGVQPVLQGELDDDGNPDHNGHGLVQLQQQDRTGSGRASH
jgi:hypothetical protein